MEKAKPKKQSLETNNYRKLTKLLESGKTVKEISVKVGYNVSTIYKAVHKMEAIDNVDRNYYLSQVGKNTFKRQSNSEIADVSEKNEIIICNNSEIIAKKETPENSDKIITVHNKHNFDSVLKEYENFIAEVEKNSFWSL